MTPRAEQCCWVWREQIASGEGFEKKTTAGCGNADCLNGGVHPMAVLLIPVVVYSSAS
jgi:hypothetical protein